MKFYRFPLLAAMKMALAGAAPPPPPVPAAILAVLPPGYDIIASGHVVAGRPARDIQIVALGRKGEEAKAKSGDAPPRPLLILEKRGNKFTVVARNDHVVLKADEGGQCDPFLDGGGTIAVKGRYFTIENGVACGQHWTDFVTFRLDERYGFVFDNERMESWSLNSSRDPNAEALVRDGPPHVSRDKPGHVTTLPERAVARVGPLAQPGRWPSWRRPTRLLGRPEPLDGVLALLPDAPPRRFTWRGRLHVVVAGDGPERIHGEWWRREGEVWAVRDYFRVEDESGGRFWLFRRGDGVDGTTGDLSWYMHGLFG